MALSTTLDFSQHLRGPVLGARNAAKGLFSGAPIDVLARRQQSVFFEDFHGLSVDTIWTTTAAVSGTGDVIQHGALGFYRIDTGAATNNQGLTSVQYTSGDQSANGTAPPKTGRVICYETRVRFSDAIQGDWLIGLAEVDTTCLTAATGVVNVDNFAGFSHISGGLGVPVPKATSSISTNVTNPTSTYTSALAANTYYHFGVRIEDTNRVRWYIDGEPVTAWTTLATAFDFSADTEGMTPSFALLSDGNVQNTMDVDYVLACVTR